MRHEASQRGATSRLVYWLASNQAAASGRTLPGATAMRAIAIAHQRQAHWIAWPIENM